MSDIKVGDRVTVKNPNSVRWYGVATVTGENIEGFLILHFDQSDLKGGFKPDEVQKVAPPMRTRAEVLAEFNRYKTIGSAGDDPYYWQQQMEVLTWVLNEQGE